MNKPFASAADQNKDPILDVLTTELQGELSVLELGSGTGQHACHFAAALPNLQWQPTDLANCQDAIHQWVGESDCPNINAPVVLDVRDLPWSVSAVDVCYTANTLHIVDWNAVVSLFEGCASVLSAGGRLIAYGPFSIDGNHTSDGNERFDTMLRDGDSGSGIRDLNDLNDVARSSGFDEARRHQMPVNNLLLIWDRT